MAAAAAAAAATISMQQRNSTGSGGSRSSGAAGYPPRPVGEWRPLGRRGPPGSLVCTALVSLGFLGGGSYFFISASTKQREESVQVYDEAVATWEDDLRNTFASSTFSVSARLVDYPEAGPFSTQLRSSEEDQLTLHDAEDGAGIEDYRPQTFISSLELPLEAQETENATATGSDFETHTGVSRVNFTIAATTSNGTKSDLELSVFLAFTRELRRARATTSVRCPLATSGVWKNSRCYIRNLLTSVCVQLELDPQGRWQLHRRGRTNTSYGCDESNGWRVGQYEEDECWGSRSECAAATELDVNITLRHAGDPRLMAAELTHSTYNFGRSEGSNLTLGWVFCGAGFVLSLPIVIAVVISIRAKKRRNLARALDEQALSPVAKGFGRPNVAHEL